jgi:universal stress protein E
MLNPIAPLEDLAAPAVIPSIEKILVVVDPTASAHPCIEKAVRIAARLGSALELFICDAEQSPPESRELRRQQFAETLVELAAPLRARGLIVTTACEHQSPLEQGIGEYVIRTKPDLVIKDTHRDRSTARGAFALTDWTLINQVPANLLLVRAEPWPAQPRIAVATDPCHPADRPESLDERMIATGCLLANATGGTVEALHVLQTPPHLPGLPVPSIERARAHGAARDIVEKVVARASNLALPMPIQFVEGNVAPGIVAYATARRPDLLVIGAAARTRWLGSNAGGTAARILEELPCDALIMKPRGFVSPLLTSDEG